MRKLLLSAFLVCYSATSFAEPLITSVRQGDNLWRIEGKELKGVSGMTLDLTYSSDNKEKPQVLQGDAVAGWLMVSNTTKPGRIRIAMVSASPIAIEENGVVASVRFGQGTGNGSEITSIKAELIDSRGKPIKYSSRLGADEGFRKNVQPRPGMTFTLSNP